MWPVVEIVIYIPEQSCYARAWNLLWSSQWTRFPRPSEVHYSVNKQINQNKSFPHRSCRIFSVRGARVYRAKDDAIPFFQRLTTKSWLCKFQIAYFKLPQMKFTFKLRTYVIKIRSPCSAPNLFVTLNNGILSNDLALAIDILQFWCTNL